MTATTAMNPLTAALRAAGMMALFGLLVRYGWGYFDPEMRTWALVVPAPAIGAILYLHLTGRVKALGITLILAGIAALGFWAWLLSSGRTPVPSGLGWLFVALILGFPVMCVVIGWRMLPRASP